jgi:hypothetical protein
MKKVQVRRTNHPTCEEKNLTFPRGRFRHGDSSSGAAIQKFLNPGRVGHDGQVNTE